jgi:hypothetical protein
LVLQVLNIGVRRANRARRELTRQTAALLTRVQTATPALDPMETPTATATRSITSITSTGLVGGTVAITTSVIVVVVDRLEVCSRTQDSTVLPNSGLTVVCVVVCSA